MNTTIRNLDPEAYRALKARAALTGRNIGELINEAISIYLGSIPEERKTGSLKELGTEAYGPGTEHLSEQIDDIVYGASRDR
jgi:plasmid stability protein